MDRSLILPVALLSFVCLFAARRLFPTAPLSDDEAFIVIISVGITLLLAKRLHVRLKKLQQETTPKGVKTRRKI